MFPMGFSANLVLLIWALVGGILLHSFLTNFRGMLLKPLYEEPIDTAQEILDRGKILETYEGGYYWVEFLEQSPNPVYQQLAERAVVPVEYEDLFEILEEDLQGAGTHVYISKGYFIYSQLKASCTKVAKLLFL